MTWFNIGTFLFLGVFTGVLSGLFGIGGGVILAPVLVLVFRFAQQTASGTSLVALLLPVGGLGVLEYYRSGRLSGENIRHGLLIGAGIFIGTYFGSRIATQIPEQTLRRAFAVMITGVAVKLWIGA